VDNLFTLDIYVLAVFYFFMFHSKWLTPSGRKDWKTPKELYKELNKRFRFDFDPCPANPKFDGLSIEWMCSNYVNPPYGRELSKWLKKCYDECLKGKTVVVLIPSRTDTIWWHKYVMKASEIWFVKGRLKFDDKENGAPFPSAIIIFEGGSKGFPLIKSVNILAESI